MTLLAILGLILVARSGAPADCWRPAPQPAYTYTDLGTARLSDGHTVHLLNAYKINDSGEVTGVTLTGTSDVEPYVWLDGTAYPLRVPAEYPRAWAMQINDAGDVLGLGETGSLTSFRPLFWPAGRSGKSWAAPSVLEPITTCPNKTLNTDPCDSSSASGINSHGEIIGTSIEPQCSSKTMCADVHEPVESSSGSPWTVVHETNSQNGSAGLAIDDNGQIAVGDPRNDPANHCWNPLGRSYHSGSRG